MAIMHSTVIQRVPLNLIRLHGFSEPFQCASTVSFQAMNEDIALLYRDLTLHGHISSPVNCLYLRYYTNV